jgi:hypothetical protein
MDLTCSVGCIDSRMGRLRALPRILGSVLEPGVVAVPW